MPKNLNDIGLIYIGNGAYVPGYPARDLTRDEVTQHGKDALLATGLYQEPSESKSVPAPKNNKEV